MIVTKERASEVCLMGKGFFCCSYLGAGSKGLLCLKDTPFKTSIDIRRQQESMTAMSDNCQGPPDFLPWEESNAS